MWGDIVFVKPLPVRYLKSDSFLRVCYKLLLDVGNISHDKIPGKTGDNSEPNKHGDPDYPKKVVLIEYDIIGWTFLILPQYDGHKFWVCIITIIDDLGTKLTHDPGHMQLKYSINYYQYEEIISCDSIYNHIVNQDDKDIVCKVKCVTTH